MIITVSGCGSAKYNAAVVNVLAAFLAQQKCPVETDAGEVLHPRDAFIRFRKLVHDMQIRGIKSLVETQTAPAPALRYVVSAFLLRTEAGERIVAWGSPGCDAAKPADPDDILKWLRTGDRRAEDVVSYHYHDNTLPVRALVRSVSKDFERRALKAGLPLDFHFVDLRKKAAAYQVA